MTVDKTDEKDAVLIAWPISLLAWSMDSHCDRQAQRFLNWPNQDPMNACGSGSR